MTTGLPIHYTRVITKFSNNLGMFAQLLEKAGYKVEWRTLYLPPIYELGEEKFKKAGKVPIPEKIHEIEGNITIQDIDFPYLTITIETWPVSKEITHHITYMMKEGEVGLRIDNIRNILYWDHTTDYTIGW